MQRWWDTVRRRGPAQFRGLQHILAHWREEILNYFDHRVTNGFAERKNNRFKVIIRQGYGYRNMDNLIPRLLMTDRSLSSTVEGCMSARTTTAETNRGTSFVPYVAFFSKHSSIVSHSLRRAQIAIVDTQRTHLSTQSLSDT